MALMTPQQAKQHVEDMLLVCQKYVSICDENETPRPSWLSGSKDVRPLLIDLATGERELNGLTLYNLMSIAHVHNPEIAVFAPLRLPAGRDLPEPDIQWCALGELS